MIQCICCIGYMYMYGRLILNMLSWLVYFSDLSLSVMLVSIACICTLDLYVICLNIAPLVGILHNFEYWYRS